MQEQLFLQQPDLTLLLCDSTGLFADRWQEIIFSLENMSHNHATGRMGQIVCYKQSFFSVLREEREDKTRRAQSLSKGSKHSFSSVSQMHTSWKQILVV